MNRFAPALAIALVSPALFAAPTKNECVDANTAGQAHRLAGKLLAARDDFATCASPVCPEMVRNDCRDRLAEVKRAMPSLVVSAPVTGEAFLTLDGASIPLDGRAIDADPGGHELVLNVQGNAPITHHVTLLENEKGHREAFPPLVSSRPVDVRPAPHVEHAGISPLRVAGIVTGALGLVALGFGAGFGVAGYGAWSSVQSECFQAAACNVAQAESDRSRALGFATASDAAFVIGGVLLAAGIPLFVFGHATVAASRDSAALVWRGTF